uniref:Matrix metalloproteinase-28 isoform X1 n=1 Tax=Geotrypetes seraphini TaxID=260995 RepID=A0A6P8PNP4_GEOSA|nr:matrix metalloproteinase-28 isoform X1 [Geotrypetes seraphini]XP_033777137.1 matrix metalloproteinase-28 isoform X1 [Geotrypetes seraphini]
MGAMRLLGSSLLLLRLLVLGAGRLVPEDFLQKYGYLENEVLRRSNSAQFTEALREFQWVSHLPVSGVLDAATFLQMAKPRCGVADAESYGQWAKRVKTLLAGRDSKTGRKKRYLNLYQSKKWYKHHLTYRLLNWPWYLSEHQLRMAVKTAFQLWSNVSALTFQEVSEGPADIRLAFFHGDHNDGLRNAFDGPGGALAHAFFPRRGEAHFDNDEWWSLNSKGRNLFIVMAHEIGHTLGLEHSPVKNALMSPYYKKLGRDFILSFDDIVAIRDLYGAPSGGQATQLPGNQLLRFQEWSTNVHSGTETMPLGSFYCQSSFDAIAVDLNRNLYIFKGHHVWVVFPDGKASKPQLLQKRWPGLPTTIEAAAISQEDGRFYFFKGGRCWRYRDSALELGFPQKCRKGGLPRHPDAALYYPPLSHLVVFKGPKYYVVNEELLEVELYYPRSLRDWKGVPAAINGALAHHDGFTYFFKHDQYWKFNQSKLKVVATGKWATELHWIGCQSAKTGGTAL